MNPDIKALWAAALRSGEFEQGRNYLRVEHYSIDDDKAFYSYCCLGVLCELHSKESGVEWDSAGRAFKGDSYMGAEGSLPQTVIEWAGLHDEDPDVTVGGRGRQLSAVNDGAVALGIDPLSFLAIADAIEEQL